MPGRFFLLLFYVVFAAVFAVFPAACMPEIHNPYDPKTDEFWIVQAVRCNLLGECTEPCEAAPWQTTATASAASYFGSVAVDSSCNTYAVGIITGTSSNSYTFGNIQVKGKAPVAGQLNTLIVKYAPDGRVLWAKTAVSASSNHIFNDVALDAFGNAYAVGYLTGSGNFDFGTGNISGPASSSPSSNHALIVKYAPDGRALWAKTITNASDDATSAFNSVAVNEAGEVFAAGYISTASSGSPPYSVTYTFSPGVTATTPYSGGGNANNAVIVKYDANTGTALLAKTADSGASNESRFEGVAARGGFVYAVGYLFGNGSFSFDSKSVTPAGAFVTNAAIIKYDTNLTAQNAKSTTSAPDSSSFSDVAADAAGNVYAVGNVAGSGPYNFGGGGKTAPTAGINALLVSYNTDGTIGLNFPASAPNSSHYLSVAVGPSGNLYLAGGLVDGPFTFATASASVNLTGANYSQFNAFYLKLALDGTSISGQTTTLSTSGLAGSNFRGIAVDSLGNIHTAGVMTGSADYNFGLGKMTASGNYNYPVLIRY